MTKFAEWLVGLVKDIFSALWNFVQDVVIATFDLFLTGVLAVIQLLPVPTFMQNGLQGLFSAVPGYVWFYAGHFHLGECLAMFGAAVVFRLTRKALTLFQW